MDFDLQAATTPTRPRKSKKSGMKSSSEHETATDENGEVDEVLVLKKAAARKAKKDLAGAAGSDVRDSSDAGRGEGKGKEREKEKGKVAKKTSKTLLPPPAEVEDVAVAAAAAVAEEEEEESEESEDEDAGREVIVHMENIHKTYLLGVEGVPALRGVTLSVYRGEWLAIYGTSGGGKTTMLNIIGTIDKPTKGEMTIGEVVVNPDTKDHELASIRLNTLGFVFQTFNLLSAMTARENVELPMVLKGEKPAKERRAIAEESLGKMGLGGRMDHYPNMLSGGEQQRVTIARAVANTPDLLLLDEPTGDLDTKNTEMVIKMLDRLNTEEGMTLVMVTHDMYLKNFADRVVWMRDGKVQRIEKVDKKKRMEAFRELESNSQVQLSDVSTATSAQGTASVSALTGTEGWSHTEVREPLNYRMFSKSSDAANSKKKKKSSKKRDMDD